VIALEDIRRLRLGHFTRPADEAPANAKIVVAAYLINHPGGLVLFDSGIAEGNQQVDERYHPVRRPLADALGTVGLDPGDVDLVVNCHLHADHCGGNAALAGQAHDSASEYTLAQFAWSLGGSAEVEGAGAAAPGWLAQLQEREPRRVLFAHDLAVWEAEPALGPIRPRRPSR
jgi:glyoxylase-like metal-dependent hydrolase (beta-lactamase superfamily II)